MSKILRTILFWFITSAALWAADAQPNPETKETLLPGVALSQGVTEITGVAVSPLLGVSGVGAWRYWNTPSERRSGLPWYARPWAWGTGFALLSLCFLKDSLGATLPGLLKKPLDMVELFENKLSALIASGAFVPLVAREMALHLEAERGIALPTASLTTPGIAFIDFSWLMIPVAIMAFLAVWACSHAINVLIILSPSSLLDTLLKLARTSLLACVGLIYLIAPWLAALICLVIIGLAFWLAPAALRFMIFGSRFATDILTPWRGRRRAKPEEPHVFTLGRMPGLPPRTGGRLVRLEDGSLAFRHRRACVLHERTVRLPEGSFHVERGLLAPVLVHQAGTADEMKLLLFLPRHRGQEESIVSSLKLHGARDHAVARGLASLKTWLSTLILGGKPAAKGV
jgi:hypothetical protein